MPFAEIVGQDRAVAQLRLAWAAGRLGQAYCFQGPSGVGKRATARALAQAVNCLAPAAGPDACGACPACRRIAAGGHPDVVEVRPEDKSVIGIDQIREVAARASLRPYEGRTKVWILDPADKMQEPAANALLKTLEEPAGVSLFVLVTAAPAALLPTILSRCQGVRFDLLNEAALRTILARRGRPPEEMSALLAMAAGSAERALGLDPAAARAARDRVVQEVWAALESPLRILECAERLAGDRAQLEAALEVLTGFSRDLAVLQLGGEAAALAHPECRDRAAALASRHPAAALLGVFEAQREAQRALARNANPRLTAEYMLLSMREAVSTGGVR
jgi:DNA polymerase-3 subunit delta'